MGVLAFSNISTDIDYSMVLPNGSTGKTFFFPSQLFVRNRTSVFLLCIRFNDNVIYNHNLFPPRPKFKDFIFGIFIHDKRNALRFQIGKRSIFQKFWTYNTYVFFGNVQFTVNKHCSGIPTQRNQQAHLRNSYIDGIGIGNVTVGKGFCHI